MNHKKSALLAMTLTILISLTLIPAYSHSTPITPQAVTTLSVSPPETIIWVDSFFDVYINIADVYDLSAFDITLTYDPLRMAAQSVTLLPPFNTWIGPPPEIDPLTGTVHVVHNAPNPSQPFQGSDPIFKISYVCLGPGVHSPLHLEGALINHLGGMILYIPIDGSVTQNQPQAPPINVTFRLLAIEHYYSNALSYNFECVGSQDYAMKSAEYLISTLLGYPNWQNLTTPLNGYKYTAYIHLLSNHTNAKALPYYRGPPTNSNVINEITNFLSVTQSPWETNNLTIRILYYCGHSGIATPGPAQSQTGFFLALGDRGSHLSNASDTANPSSYQELWDYQLNQTLCVNDLATNNCTLVILDSCRSQAAIQMLQRSGRVIMTACKTAELANGWVSNPAPWPPGTRDRWSFFTGQNAANAFFGNGTQVKGPLGIIGAITFGCDTNNDGWADAKEVFNVANVTTLSYSKGEAKQQVPQHHYSVMNGKIPVVQYSNKTKFPYNGRPGWGEIKANLTWPGFHHDAGHSGMTAGAGTSEGTPLWTSSGIDANASVVASECQVIAASKNGSVYGLDFRTGNKLWKFNAESSILATPFVSGGMIYIATFGGGGDEGGGMLYALDETTGRVLWEYQAPTGVGFFASPTVADGLVFAGTCSQTTTACGIYAFNQSTGELAWERSLETSVKASPTVKNGRVYVATSTQGVGSVARLHALAEFDGVKLWNYSFGTSDVVSSPTVTMTLVIVGCMGGGGGGGALGGLYAFQASSGVPAWDYPTGSPVSSSPAVDEARGLVFFGTEDGRVLALMMDGNRAWEYLAPGPVRMSSPAISGDGRLYIGTTNNWLVCLDAESGSATWSYLTDGPITSSPAIVEEHVLVGTTGSSVYCFGSPFPEHDLATQAVFPQRSSVIQGDPVTIEYTVKNEGNVPEDVTVTVGSRNSSTPSFGDITALYEDTFTLGVDSETTRYYVWDTTGVPADTYRTCAIANTINGETDIADNMLVNGSVSISLPGVHDVAVNSVTPSKTVVCQSMSMKINVEVTNLGIFLETFHVIVTARPSVGPPIVVGTQLVTLSPAETRVLTFVWLTTGVQVGSYTVEATAETVLGETYTINNVCTDGQVNVTTLGDINADNIVDISDAAQIGVNWQKTVPPANPNADLNNDGIIDISDAAIIGVHWMHTYP